MHGMHAFIPEHYIAESAIVIMPPQLLKFLSVCMCSYKAIATHLGPALGYNYFSNIRIADYSHACVQMT